MHANSPKVTCVAERPLDALVLTGPNPSRETLKFWTLSS
jgi:hypothetical protein